MASENNLSEWVWVIVEKIGQSESFYALEESRQGLTFIPVFKNQDDGLAILQKMQKKEMAEYEIQAARLSLVGQAAAKNNIELKILDGQGRILESLTPVVDGQAQ